MASNAAWPRHDGASAARGARATRGSGILVGTSPSRADLGCNSQRVVDGLVQWLEVVRPTRAFGPDSAIQSIKQRQRARR